MHAPTFSASGGVTWSDWFSPGKFLPLTGDSPIVSSLRPTIKTPGWSHASQSDRARPAGTRRGPGGRGAGPVRSGLVSPSPDQAGAAPRPAAPLPLTVATGLVALEAAVLVVEGVALVPALSGDRLTMGVTSVFFFLLYGGFLAVLAWRLHRLESWARAPVVLAQLIQVLVGVSFWGGSTTGVAVVAIVVGLVVLAGVFHPASLAALEADGRRGEPQGG